MLQCLADCGGHGALARPGLELIDGAGKRTLIRKRGVDRRA
jgi:hypothetical protein